MRAALFFAAVTAAVFHDVLAAPATRVLSGHQVGGQLTWMFWWFAHALREGLPLFHTGLLFFPNGASLYLDCPLVEAAAVAVQALGAAPAAAYNLLMVACFPLAGLAAWSLFYDRTRDRLASLCGAFAYAASAYMAVQYWHGQINTAWVCFNPLLALAWLRWTDRPSPGRAAWVGAALAGVLLSAPYTAFCFGVVFVLGAIAFELWGGRRSDRRELATLGAAMLSAGALAAAVYWPLIGHTGAWVGARPFYSTPLSAFFDPPFWHSAGWVQALRPLKGMGARPESLMAWLGLGCYAAIGWTLLDSRLRRDREERFWLWILALSAVLSLGPSLELLPGRDTGLPLPYRLFQVLPFTSSFQNSGRILMTTSLAAAALLALAFARASARLKAPVKAAAAIGLILLTAFEFDLPQFGRWTIDGTLPAAYAPIRADADPHRAVLVLPNSVDEAGRVMQANQYYMLLAAQHHHALVLGNPSRHLASSLDFTETTEAVYELTHPWVLKRLEEEPRLKTRAAELRKKGRAKLAAAGIAYVVYHERVPAYDSDTRNRLESWLQSILGSPSINQDGVRLWSLQQ